MRMILVAIFFCAECEATGHPAGLGFPPSHDGVFAEHAERLGALQEPDLAAWVQPVCWLAWQRGSMGVGFEPAIGVARSGRLERLREPCDGDSSRFPGCPPCLRVSQRIVRTKLTLSDAARVSDTLTVAAPTVREDKVDVERARGGCSCVFRTWMRGSVSRVGRWLRSASDIRRRVV